MDKKEWDIYRRLRQYERTGLTASEVLTMRNALAEHNDNMQAVANEVVAGEKGPDFKFLISHAMVLNKICRIAVKARDKMEGFNDE